MKIIIIIIIMIMDISQAFIFYSRVTVDIVDIGAVVRAIALSRAGATGATAADMAHMAAAIIQVTAPEAEALGIKAEADAAIEIEAAAVIGADQIMAAMAALIMVAA